MNDKFIWWSKHWGLAIGIISAGVGIVLAAPENMNTWQQAERHSKVMGIKYSEINYYRTNEIIPKGFKVTQISYGRHEKKALGTGLVFLGSAMVWVFAQSLAQDYERIEARNNKIRQSEFELENIQLDQNVEVQRWAIELDAQSDISNMLNPPKSYMELESEEEKPENQKFSQSSTGFLAWLQSKNIREARVRDLAQQSFNGQKVPTEQLRNWIDELVISELAEWLDEDKKEFRLLNQ